jgi:uncharacterized protein
VPANQVEVLSRVDCLELFGKVPVGRIGISVGALPVILPVNFALVEEAVVFRAVPGTKLAAATANSVVAFEVDAYEIDGASGWSVLVQGTAAEVIDPTERAALAERIGQPWGVAALADRIISISATKISGRRFGERAESKEPVARS